MTTVIFLCASRISAQNAVTGKITDVSNGKPVAYVNVSLLRLADSVLVGHTAADDKGSFLLQQIPDGNYRLVAYFIGYENHERQINVHGDTDAGTIELKAGTTTIGEVVVKGERPLFAVDGEKTLYNTAEDPTVQTGSVSDVLQNAPGVSVDVEGNVSLRGSSSVEIWINDKPSHMTSENLKTYLQQMPANSVDHVEVITNPSARYGSKADGIINIVTTTKVKRNQFVSFGANASITPYVSPWFSYVWSNEKVSLNLYSNLSYSLHKNSYTAQTSIFQPSNDERELLSFEKDSTYSKGHNYGGGIHFSLDYEIDSANSLSVWSSIWPNGSRSTSSEFLNREMFLIPSITNYNTLGKGGDFGFWGGAGVYYEHKFNGDGHVLSLDFNTDSWSWVSNNILEMNFTSPVERNRTRFTKNSMLNFDITGELTYTYPYSEHGEISAGYYGGYTFEKEFANVDTLRNGFVVNDSLRSNLMRAPSSVNQIFFTLEHKFGNFTIKPGIRLEHEYISLLYPDIATTEYNISRHFFHARPSLHLSYRTKSLHNFRLSYTFRAITPDASDLTRKPSFEEESFSSGNPDLENILTHSLEAGWTKYWTKYGSVGVTLYFRGKSRDMNTITIPMYHELYGREVSYSKPVNVGKSTNTGLELNTMFRPNAMFNMRFYANVYHSYLETLYDNQLYKSQMWSYSFDLSVWAKLWKRLEISVSGTYRSPSQTLFRSSKAYYGINAGLRADFFDKKLSIFLNANDIFNWNKWGGDVSSPYLESSSTYKYNSRTVSLGFTLRFGKMELESQARQGAGAENSNSGMGR